MVGESGNVIDLDESIYDGNRYYTREDLVKYVTTRVKMSEKKFLGNRLLGGRYEELENEVIQVMLDHANGM